MKNFLLTIAVASCCVIGAQAQQTNTFDEPIPRLVENQNPGEYADEFNGHLLKSYKQDPKINSNGEIEYQHIQTKYTFVLFSHTFHDFSNDFVVTANDFGGKLPNGAKVTRLGVDGYNNGGGITKFSSLDLYVWNLDAVKDLEYKKGYGTNWNEGLNASDLYCNGAPKNGFNAESTKDNITEVISLPFKKAFEYTGKDIQLKLHMQYTSTDDNDNNYMNFDFQKASAEKEIASVYRSGNYAFSTKGVYYSKYISVKDPFASGIINIEANTIPAFKLDYYTNDIHVKVQNRMALGSNEVVPTAAYITLTDKTDNKVIFDGTNEKAATERWFENLDYTHTYTLKVENRFTAAKEVELNFEGIENDIEVVFTSTGVTTGVEDANVAKAVAGVKYYNLAGVESTEPFTGVNIVKTTYTDGSQSVAKKVIK